MALMGGNTHQVLMIAYHPRRSRRALSGGWSKTAPERDAEMRSKNTQRAGTTVTEYAIILAFIAFATAGAAALSGDRLNELLIAISNQLDTDAQNPDGSPTTPVSNAFAGANAAPRVVDASQVTGDLLLLEGAPISARTVHFDDPDGETLNFALEGSWPAGLSLSRDDENSVVVTGTPSAFGVYDELAITATDPRGESVTTSRFTIDVNGSPSLVSGLPSGTTQINTGETFPTATVSFTDPDGDALSFTPLGSWPAGLALTNATGTSFEIAGTPTTPGFYDNLRIQADDGRGASITTDSFAIDVMLAPKPPSELTITHQNQSASFDITWTGGHGFGTCNVIANNTVLTNASCDTDTELSVNITDHVDGSSWANIPVEIRANTIDWSAPLGALECTPGGVGYDGLDNDCDGTWDEQEQQSQTFERFIVNGCNAEHVWHLDAKEFCLDKGYSDVEGHVAFPNVVGDICWFSHLGAGGRVWAQDNFHAGYSWSEGYEEVTCTRAQHQ